MQKVSEDAGREESFRRERDSKPHVHFVCFLHYEPYRSAQVDLIKRFRQSPTPKSESLSSLPGGGPQDFVSRAC